MHHVDPRLMLLAYFATLMMLAGLFFHQRAVLMVEGTGYATLARFEAERAAEASLLITILSAPWLLLAAWWIY